MIHKIIEKLASNFKERETFGKVIANISWLMFDKFFRMGVGLIVSIWVIRYLGKPEFGKWTYVIAFYSLFSVLGTLGLDAIVLREIVSNPQKKYEILGSTFTMRLIGAILAVFGSCTAFFWWTNGNVELLKMMLVVSSSSVFLAFDTIDLHFKTELKSKFTVLSKNVAFLIASGLRVVLILTKASLMAFVWANAIEIVIGAIILIWGYGEKYTSILNWKSSFAYMAKLWGECWLWALGIVLTMVYMKIDQIFLGDLIDEKSLGIYGASLKIYDIAYSFASMVMITFFPKLAELYNRDIKLFEQKFVEITSYFSVAGIILAIGVYLLGDIFCDLLYGNQYEGVKEILPIHFIAMIFVFNGIFRSTYLSITKNNQILLYANIVTVIFILPLDYLMIKEFGLKGAAYMSIITQSFAFVFSNFLFTSTRKLFYFQFYALWQFFNPFFYKNKLF